MSKYILKYKRTDAGKYISHLDFVRFIQRVMRRAGLDMEYSQGFNPHPQMMIALPLSVGVTADGELMKIGFINDYGEEELKNIINSSMTEGFEIVAVKKIQNKEIDLTKINMAQYYCKCELSGGEIPDIDAFMKNESLLIPKKSKSGIKETDIKPHIHKLDIVDINNDEITFSMLLDAGNLYNLKPDTVIDAMQKYCNDFNPVFFSVHRQMLLSDGKELF